MVSMAQNRSLAEVLRAVVAGIAVCPEVVLARIWLVGAGDRCGTCRFRGECPDQTRCLHLVASAGNFATAGSDATRLDGNFCRFPLGVRKIGKVGQSAAPLLLPGLKPEDAWIAEPEWARRESIRTFAAQPLVFRGETLGVLGLFDRGVLEQGDFDWLRVFADHAAVSIANARAFEEIATLKDRLERENDYLREEVTEVLGSTDLVGSSLGLRKVIQQIQLVAPTDASVLVTGESGTGKELVARAIHEQSGRKNQPLIKVNCGAIPEALFESEFFGHVKGAFTGALRDRSGRFELADGGTLFLDEIGEVPLPMQAKLLRALQEQEIERVGDTRTRRVNVRILAATNRDLRAEAVAGRFRQDLFYRLSVFPIEMPALRERRDDIPALAEHFVTVTARRMNRPVPRLSRSNLAQLLAHAWPGNVRELQNAVERAVILSQGGPLTFDLHPAISPRAKASIPAASSTTEPSAEGILTRQAMKERERINIETALLQCRGKVFGPGGAAERLGMRPTTLASRIRVLGLHGVGRASGRNSPARERD